jgi:hypothetical protein
MDYHLYTVKGAEGFEQTGTAAELWPDTSFPAAGPNQEWLASVGAVPLRQHLPHDPATERLQAVDPYMADDGAVYSVIVAPLPPPPPVPDWLRFNDAINRLPAIRQLLATLKEVDIGAAMTLAIGLGQAAQGSPGTFLHAWPAARAAGLVSPETAAEVEAIGRAHDLPEDFLAALVAPQEAG